MLHVVGNLCRDTVLTVDRFPAPGETLVARDNRSGWGGKGLNQAVAAARAGAPVTLHAAVGIGDVAAVLADLSGEPWPILRLESMPGASDASTVLVRPDGENLIVSATACAQGFDPAGGTDPVQVAAGDMVLLQGNLSRPVTEACLTDAKRQGARTVLNPSPLWGEPIAWHAVDLAVLNVGELHSLTGSDDPAEGAQLLRDAGVGAVVVTLGARGALLLDRDRQVMVPAPPVKARDTAGAGDVLCGVLVALLGRGVPAEAALGRAVAAAALSVTRPGALASCPSAAEMASLIAPVVSGCFE